MWVRLGTLAPVIEKAIKKARCKRVCVRLFLLYGGVGRIAYHVMS